MTLTASEPFSFKFHVTTLYYYHFTFHKSTCYCFSCIFIDSRQGWSGYIHTLGGFSAHADQPSLLAWAGSFKRPPQHTFVVHGEVAAAIALAERLQADKGWEVTVPALGQNVQL